MLEIGVGTGRVAVPLLREGISVTGIDISPRMLAVMRAKTIEVDAILAEATNLPFPDATFDAVLMVHLLHLVPDVGDTLRAAASALRPAGLVISCRTAWRHNELSEADAIINNLIAAHTQEERPRHRDRDSELNAAFEEAMSSLGATMEERLLATWTDTSTARTLLNEVRGRVRSNYWELPKEAVERVLAEAEPRIAAITRGLDRPIEGRATFIATIARMP